MHHWGDDFAYFSDVEDAAEYIREFCVKWARLGGQSKEKYGTARFYANFGVYNLHSLTHPGWANYAWYPKWLIKFDIYYAPIMFKYSGINWLFSKWQPYIYYVAYKKALHKWPHIQAEILDGADYPELLKEHYKKEKNKLHLLDLNGNIVGTWTTMGSEE